MTPDEVLQRRNNAPERYAEGDVWLDMERQAAEKQLPDSDLLKALHVYTSDYYKFATKSRGKRDWRSMEETALLALGVLLEETAGGVVGETGDLAFVESQDADNQTIGPMYWNGQRWIRSVVDRRSVGRTGVRDDSRARVASENE